MFVLFVIFYDDFINLLIFWVEIEIQNGSVRSLSTPAGRVYLDAGSTIIDVDVVVASFHVSN